jgi:hypothetical protein
MESFLPFGEGVELKNNLNLILVIAQCAGSHAKKASTLNAHELRN